MPGIFKEDSKRFNEHYLEKQMNSIKRSLAIGIPAIIGMGIAWVGNQIIKNEKTLKDRELELKLQLNKFD